MDLMDLIPSFYNASDRIWSGAEKIPIYNSESSVGKIIFCNLKNWPKNILQICDTDGRTVTNGEALLWAIRIAQNIKKRGLDNKDVIGIVARNTTYLMPLGVACLMNTTPFHAINPMMDEKAMKHLFEITKPKLVFCDGSELEKVRNATKSFEPEIFTMSDHFANNSKIEDLLEPTKTELFYEPMKLSDGKYQTMAILSSSGTTGLPKAVCISNSSFIQENMLMTSETILYNASGLDWITGLWSFIFCTVFGAKRIISNKPFSVDYFIDLVKKYKINNVLIPPRYMCALVNSPKATPESLASISMLSYGGGFVFSGTLQRAQAICKNALLNSGYGMTEAGAISVNIGIKKTASAGKLLPGVRARIVDENGNNLSSNERGEIVIHNGNKWNGYYNNSKATQEMQDSDGWFHTGDLGYFDENNQLYIVDRKKEILKYEGQHYWPTEIEQAISELPEVQEVCVVGIYDERAGDAATALVVKRNGSLLSEKAIQQHVMNRLEAKHKHLHGGVHFIDKLPQTVNGKIIRKAAKEILIAQN